MRNSLRRIFLSALGLALALAFGMTLSANAAAAPSANAAAAPSATSSGAAVPVIRVEEKTVLASPAVYKGLDYSPVFDAAYYRARYPEVARAIGSSGSALLKHFVEFGMAEGRRGNEAFSVLSYRNRYPDLRQAIGTDWKAYYMHYLNSGRAEGRIGSGMETSRVGKVRAYLGVDYSAVFDPDYYWDNNADLHTSFSRMDDVGLLQHFITAGMSEGRQGAPTFSVRSYRFLYADLRAAYGNDLKAYYMHYIQAGQKEGRLALGYDYDPATASNATPAASNAAAAGASNAAAGASNAAAAGTSNPAEAAARQKAAAIADALGWDIHACLNWSAAMPYERNNSFDSTKSTAFLANYGFDNRRGNCGVMAATFYEMAKYLGYDAHQVWGEVPLRRGGMGMHSWVELVIDGQIYICDPDFQNETKKSGYMLRYKQSGTWRYSNYHRVN